MGVPFIREAEVAIMEESKRLLINEDFHPDDALHFIGDGDAVDSWSVSVDTTAGLSFSGGGALRLGNDPGALADKYVRAWLKVLSGKAIASRFQFFTRYLVDEADTDWLELLIEFRAYDGTPQGQDGQTWSAAMYLYAAACVEQRRTPFFDEVRPPGA